MSIIREKDGLLQQSNPNILINGDMSVWQRSLDATGSGYTSIDRWILWGANTRCARNSALQDYLTHVIVTDPSGGIGQRIEDGWRFNGKTMTFSFYWQPEAGYGYNGQVEVKFSDGGSDRSRQFHDVELRTAGRKEITFTMDSTGTHDDYLQIRLHMNKGASATESARIYRAKLEIGEIATEFLPEDIVINRTKCERYYERGLSEFLMFPWNSASQLVKMKVPYKTEKRDHAHTAILTKTAGNATVSVNQTNATGFLAGGQGGSNDNTIKDYVQFNWTADSEL